ncbi:MAG TPA: hypothetical protein VGG74_27995 [Kofleriaceae bacterium]|jgi:hypothetical protein
MTNTRRGFLGRRGWVWTVIASWFVPAIMTIAYFVFAITAGTTVLAMSWFGLGYLMVLCVWFIIRTLTQTAALSRAFDVGDGDLMLEISTHALTQRFVTGRMRLRLYQAAAYELRSEWPNVLAKVAEANVGPDANRRLRALAASLSITALVESGEIAKARALVDELAPLEQALNQRLDAQLVCSVRLARSRVLVAEGDPHGRVVLQQVIDDIRTGAATRDRARALLADQKIQSAVTPA